MGATNPRLLAVILEDLQEEMTRWASSAGETMVIADYTQSQTREQLEQQEHRANILREEAADDVNAAESAHVASEALVADLREAQRTAQATLQDTVAAWQRGQQALTHWRAELAYAKAWLARAEERVRLAEIELERARAALTQAEREYNRAVDSYNACVNYRDKEGRSRDCSGERARVRQAEVAVKVAVEEVKRALVELEAAVAERARARRRVECCTQAVGLAEQAVATANSARQLATNSLNAAERGQESADMALHYADQARQQAEQEEAEAEEVLAQVRAAAEATEEAHQHLRLAERAEESAQRLRIMADAELVHRVASLYEMNRPTLAGGAPSAGISSFVSHTSAGNTLYNVAGGSSLAADMIAGKLQRQGVANISSPTEWGKFSHKAIQDAIRDHDPQAWVEHYVCVISQDGVVRKGRLDALTQGVILEIKTHNLDQFSDNQLERTLDGFARQMEGYRNSPDMIGTPNMAIFLEKKPSAPGRDRAIESFFRGRDIAVIWGAL